VLLCSALLCSSCLLFLSMSAALLFFLSYPPLQFNNPNPPP